MAGGEAAEDKKDAAPEAAAEEGAAKAAGSGAEGGGEATEGDEDEVGIIGETPKISVEDFFRKVREKAAEPDRGDTAEERRHWAQKRRWKVRIWDVRIENAIKDNHMYAFANFIFGGNREEFMVKPGDGNDIVWVAGTEGHEVRTPVVQDVPGDGVAADLDFDESFEWRGSYMDLEGQSLRIELWNWSRFRVNKFDSYHQELLLSYAQGNIRNEVECVKMNKWGKRLVRARICFKLYFQEIFDFKLSFMAWRATGLRSCAQTLDLLAKGDDLEGKGAASAVDKAPPGSGPSAAGVVPVDARGSVASMASVASVLGSCEGQRIEVIAPWTRGWCSCPCRSRGRSFMSRSTPMVSGCSEWRQWDGRSVYFRGTCSELNNLSFQATIFSAEKYRKLGLARAPWGSRRVGIPLCRASIPLKGILEHGETQAELVPAPWFYQAEGGHRAKKHDSGTLHGHVVVEKQPRYQQREDLAGDLDLKNRYLFVRVIKVDRVVTPDTRPTTDIDTWVEVTFDGKCRSTCIKQDTSAPYFDEELVFEISLARTVAAGEAAGPSKELDEQQACEEIENKGPVHFDLWTKGPLSNDHLGSCEAFLSEILRDERGTPQKTMAKTAKDKLKKEEEDFEVRVLRGQRQLSFIWGEGGASHLFFEMWFLPDFGKNAKLKRERRADGLPKTLAARFPQLQERWAQKTSGFCHEGRQFPCTVMNQWEVGMEKAEGCFLPRLVDVLKPPRGLDNGNAICHFVGCIPYMAKKSPSPMAFTPDFFGRIKKGEALDHAILHAGLLMGAGQLAFVCLGTSMKREPHAWVATLQADGTVCFWEPFLGMGPRWLPRRLAQPEALSGGRLPKSFPQESVQAEVDRRKRLRLQREARPGASTQLELCAKSVHQHPLAYANSSTGLHVEAHCAECKSYGHSKGFAHGFVCQEEGCRYALCWQCAEPHWGDRAALDGLSFDPTEPYDFDDARDNGAGLRQKEVPYRSVEVVFNNANCWANVQHRDPRKILWDLWNPTYWHPFAPKSSGIRPCFTGCRFADKEHNEATCASLRRQVLQQVQSAVRSRRSSRNLDTNWVRNPALATFLEAGLKLRAQLDVCHEDQTEALRQQLSDWEHALAAKTPPRHCFRGAPLHFGYCDPATVAREAVELSGLADAREKSTRFAIAVHLVLLPGEVVSLYLLICSMHRLTDLEVAEEIRHREVIQGKNEGGQLLSLLRKAHEAIQNEQSHERPSMSAFEEAVHSDFVRISNPKQGESVATYIGPKQGSGYKMCGGVIGNGPIPCSAEGKYFEVQVVRVSKGHPNGMAIGVTTRCPDSLEKVPSTMDKVKTSWLAGFDGRFWDGAKEAWTAATWRSSDLAVGDHVGCLVVHPGEVTIFVNGEEVLSWRGEIPGTAPLYAVVDLIGNTDAVLLVINGKPPPTSAAAAAPAPAKPAAPMPVEPTAQLPEGPAVAEHHGQQALEGTEEPGDAGAARSQGEPRDEAKPAEPSSQAADSPTPHRAAAERAGGAEPHDQEKPARRPKPKPKADTEADTQAAARPTDAPPLAVASKPQAKGRKPKAEESDSEATARVQPTTHAATPLRRGDDSNMSEMDVGSDEAVPSPNGMVQRPSVMRVTAGGATMPRASMVRASVPRASVRQSLLPDDSLPKPLQSKEDTPPPAVATESGGAGGTWMGNLWNMVSGGPAPPVMSGFSHAVVGDLVDLSADGLTAVHRGESGAELSGGLLGDGALPRFAAGWYFEVRVDSVRDRVGEGLAVGVTLHGPGEVAKAPEAMEELGDCFLVSAEGSQFDGSSWSPCSWRLGHVREGDHIGVLVTPNGEMHAIVNGRLAATGDFTVPCDSPLFAVVDLVGATAGVTLLPGAEPPAKIAADPETRQQADAVAESVAKPQQRQGGHPSEASASSHKAPIMRGFSRMHLGDQVVLSADGLEASLREGANEDGPCGGLVFGDGRLPPLPSGGVAYALAVVAARPGRREGLAVGVTAQLPDAAEAHVASADKVSSSWFAGCDGSSWDGSRRRWLLCEWTPSDLKVGDVVETQVTASGDLSIFVNDKQRATHALGIPTDVPLFAMVELLGGTRGVRLRPPSSGSKGAVPATSKTKPAELVPATSKAKPAELVQEEPEMRGFHRTRIGSLVSLSADGRAASRARGAEGDAHCVLIGDGPLRATPDGGVAFALAVTAARGGAATGPALGLTTRRPRDFEELPETADQVNPSWLVGYDGATWDGATWGGHSATWGFSSWSPGGLAAGDLVELRASAEGKLQILVNHIEHAVHAMHIPMDKQLFVLVDLQGGTTGVSLVPPGEIPPPSSAGAAARAPALAAPTPGFSRASLGRSLVLSPDGQTATRAAGVPPGSDCVLLSSHALEAQGDGGVCFGVSITAVSEGPSEGLALGVTTRSPAEIGPPPANADHVNPCWLVGFDGATWNSNTREWGFSDWDPNELKVGDIVLVRVTTLGELCISVNGKLHTSHGLQVPSGKPLFALADLGGPVAGVSLVSVGEAPSAAKATSSSSPSAKTAKPGKAGSSQPRDGLGRQKPMPSPKVAPTMCGFCRAKIGGSLELSKDGRSVSRKVKAGVRPHSVLLGDAALERAADGGASFEISIAAVVRDAEEGLAVGVTTRSPDSIRELPDTADELTPCWLAGFDGATWNGSAWGFGKWHPSGLKAGDRVEVSVTGQGQLCVSVNGALVDSHSLGIPRGEALFVLMDLAGHASGISLLRPQAPKATALAGGAAKAPAGLPRERAGSPGGVRPSLAPPLPPRPAETVPGSPRAGGPSPRPAAGYPAAAKAAKQKKEGEKDQKGREKDERREKKEKKELKDLKEPKEPKALKEPKEPKAPKAPKEPQEPKQPKAPREAKEVRDPKDSKEPKPLKEGKEKREKKERRVKEEDGRAGAKKPLIDKPARE